MIDEVAEAEPFAPFRRWLDEAWRGEPNAHAMTLATATAEGRPSARAVLLKGLDDRGFVFYTNLESRKSKELLTNRTVRSDTAMTGEISLRGLVLPVGGIKEKVVAAAGASLATVILPARNRKDYDDIPESARNSLRFIWAERVEDVIAAALEPAAQDRPAMAEVAGD